MTLSPLAIPELVDRVLDHLHDDSRSLRICTRVAKAWLPTSRYHLFSDITIDTDRAYEGFVSYSRRNLTFSHGVRRLTLSEPYGAPWVYGSKILDLLATTPSLRAVTWDYVSLPRNIQFMDLKHAYHTIRELSIESCNIPSHEALIRLLQAFPTLHRLTISNAFPGPGFFERCQRPLEEPIAGHRISVQELWLDSNPHYPLDSLLDAVMDEASPRVLHVSYTAPREFTLCRVLGNRLEELHITVGQWRSKTLLPAMSLPKLRHIRIVLNVARAMNQASASEELDLAFRAVPLALTAPSLQIIEYFFNGYSTDAERDERPGSHDWSGVRKAFLNLRRKAKRPMIVKICWREGQEGGLDLQAVDAGLRELTSLGLVVFEAVPQKHRMSK